MDLWQKRTGEPLFHVGEYARCLHDVLQRCCQCQCCAVHDTLLRLERRQTTKKRAKFTIHFNLLFVSRGSGNGDLDKCSWQQMEVRVVPKEYVNSGFCSNLASAANCSYPNMCAVKDHPSLREGLPCVGQIQNPIPRTAAPSLQVQYLRCTAISRQPHQTHLLRKQSSLASATI
jgi:hypothetical protein